MLRYALSYVMFLVIAFFVLLVEGNDRVRLTDVSALTFQRGHYTTARRGSPIPQLECVGGSAVKHPEFYPYSAQCYNKGNDGQDVQWECKAELDKDVRLGRITVSCEGYAYPDDPFVLRGSCALQYELDFKDGIRSERRSFSFPTFTYPRWSPSVIFSPIVALLGLVILAVAIWFFCLRDVSEQTHGPVGFDEMPGPTAPPPSYDEATRRVYPEFPDSTTRQRPTSTSNYGWQNFRSYAPGPSDRYPKEQTQSSSWLSSGLAAGAGFLGGYFLGSRDQQTRQPRPSRTLYPDLDTLNEDTAPPRPSTSTSTVTGNNDRYIATGYSSTSRR